MSRVQRETKSQNGGYSGFTLLELLVTIGIIGLLAALLLTGIQAARTSVQTAKASQEIRNFETAMAQFQSEFGGYPPSSIALYEAVTGDPSWSTDTANPTRLTRSLALIRKFWPDFNPAGGIDLNSDGDATDVIELNGAECLVFFLGGVAEPQSHATKANLRLGFSKNPTNPFSTTGENRLGPFYEFQLSQFIDLDGDEMEEYKDSLPGQTRPLAYFSSYNGEGYRAADADATGTVSPLTVYQQLADEPFNQNSFQIISPGVDNEFGTGGVFSEDSSKSTISQADQDNITNFVTGKLN